MLNYVRRQPPKGLLRQHSFRGGFAALRHHRLSFDAMVWHPPS